MTGPCIIPISLLTVAVCICVCTGQVPEVQNLPRSSSVEEKGLLHILRPARIPMTRLYHPHRRQSAATLRDIYSKCSCGERQCGCCLLLVVPEIKLNAKGCVNVTYLPEEQGFKLTASINGLIVLNKTLLGQNPPSLCAGIPYIEKYASICVTLTDLEYKEKEFFGCVSAEIKFKGEVYLISDFGCFQIPPSVDARGPNIVPMVAIEKSSAQSPVVPYKYQRLQTVESLQYQANDLCSCRGYSCGCCIRLHVERISFNETGCLTVSFLPSELGFEFQATLDGIVLIDKKVSVSNPPPFCVAAPFVHNLASVCVQFRDLQIKNEQLSGCASFEVVLGGLHVESFDLGCFQIPPKNM